MPTLSVALYDEGYEDMAHSALILEGLGVFFVSGGLGEWKLDLCSEDAPEHAKRQFDRLWVASIKEEHMKKFKLSLEHTPVPKNNILWNSDNYVLDVLETLYEVSLLDRESNERAQREIRRVIRNRKH